MPARLQRVWTQSFALFLTSSLLGSSFCSVPASTPTTRKTIHLSDSWMCHSNPQQERTMPRQLRLSNWRPRLVFIWNLPPRKTARKAKQSLTEPLTTMLSPRSTQWPGVCSIYVNTALLLLHHFTPCSNKMDEPNASVPRTCVAIGNSLGLTARDISARVLRAGGAMALLRARVDSCIIRLLGHWKSWAMLEYLHRSATNTTPYAQMMMAGGRYTIDRHATLPADIPLSLPSDPLDSEL
jgi:hypothetical protein